MCGIVGIIERDLAQPVAPEDLARMVQQLHHRGPDEEGSVVLPGVGLGMRRLAIVDLKSGQQPIPNETGEIKIVANGEIYNFRELQKELESFGHRFRSRDSDIEVLVHAYEQWGEDFLVRLRGMQCLEIVERGGRPEIALVDDRDRKSALGGVPGRCHAVKAAAHDNDVERGVRQSAEIAHHQPVIVR